MVDKIIEECRKRGNYSFENIVEKNTLTDDEFFKILSFIYLENIPEIRTSVDGKDFIVLEDENYYLSEREIIKTYLEDIKIKNKEINKNSQLIDKYLKVGVKNAVEYSKFGFTFLDLVQEGTLGVMAGLNYVDKIKEISENIDFFIEKFSIKYILEYQKAMLKEIKSSELSYMLYLKMKVEREMGRNLEEICRDMNVTVEYIEELEKIFDKFEIDGNDISNEDVLNRANKITQIYILENIPKKLSYIDERILIMSYGLEEKIYTDKEIAKELNISLHNVGILKEKALNKLSIDLLKNEFTENTENNEFILN